MASEKLATLILSTMRRVASKHGPARSATITDTFFEVTQDLATISTEWNEKLAALFDTVPCGLEDATVDAYANGLDGANLYVHAEASTDSYPAYFDSIAARPHTIAEQFGELYDYVDTAKSDIEARLASSYTSAAAVPILDSLDWFSSTNVEGALVELATAVDSLQSSGTFFPITGGVLHGHLTLPITVNLRFSDTLGVVDTQLSRSLAGVLRALDGNGSIASFDATRYYVNGGPFWSSGSGNPEGSVTAPVGSLYTRTSGGVSTTLYVKTSGSGSTGWTAK